MHPNLISNTIGVDVVNYDRTKKFSFSIPPFMKRAPPFLEWYLAPLEFQWCLLNYLLVVPSNLEMHVASPVILKRRTSVGMLMSGFV